MENKTETFKAEPAEERPAYRVLDPAGFFGPDMRLWEEGSEIYLDGEPSVEMEPLNDAAKRKMTALYEKLDELGRAAAEKAGRPFTGRPRTLDGAVILATAIQKAEMAIMGAAPKNADAVAPRVAPETPEVKRGRGRPKKETLSAVANS